VPARSGAHAEDTKIRGPDGQEHDAEPVGFRSSGEHFNEYLLDDGSVLRLKLVVTEVSRVKEARDAYGDPIPREAHGSSGSRCARRATGRR
jgi:hypothetical protein